MKSLSVMAMVLSLSYAFSSHPVMLMAIILTQAMFMCMIGWLKLQTSWMSYILFLIFLGGLMVLFIYIISLASNELLALNSSTASTFLVLATILILLVLTGVNPQQILNPNIIESKMIAYSYSLGSSILILTTMIYLLLTLIIVVKVSNKFEAPIKNQIF